MQHKYELAKDYVENNNLYDCDVLLAKCEYALGKYENALEISSKIYLNSIFNIVNVSLIQIMILLKKQEIQEAYELVNWTIQFINSVKNEESFFKGVLCPFIFFKAACEKLLNLSVDESINKLKAITEDCLDLNIISKAKTLKYYFGNLDEVIFIDSNIKNTFLEVIHQTDNNDVHYQVLIDIYKEIFKGDANE